MNDNIIDYKNRIKSLENDTTKKEGLLIREAVRLGFTIENSIYYFKYLKNDFKLYVFSKNTLIEIKNISSDNVNEIEANIYLLKNIENISYRKDRFYLRGLNFTIVERVFQFSPVDDFVEFKLTYSTMLESVVSNFI